MSSTEATTGPGSREAANTITSDRQSGRQRPVHLPFGSPDELTTAALLLARKRFAKILKDEPAVALALLRTLAARVRELEASPAD